METLDKHRRAINDALVYGITADIIKKAEKFAEETFTTLDYYSHVREVFILANGSKIDVWALKIMMGNKEVSHEQIREY